MNKKELNKKDIKYLFFLLILGIIVFFPNLGLLNPDLMESRNFVSAREMISNNNYIVTTLNGMLRFEKPPIPTWFTAFFMKIFDTNNEFIIRIPVTIISITFIIFIYYFVKNFTESKRYSFITSTVAATTFMITKVGTENTWDMYTYVFAFGAILFLSIGLSDKLSKGELKFFILSGIFLSLSAMSKGPVGIFGLYIPFIISYCIIYGTKKIKENILKIFIMILICISLSIIWPGIIYVNYRDVFLQVLDKEKNTWNSAHIRGYLYYLDYFIYMGIWAIFSIVALIKNWSIKRICVSDIENNKENNNKNIKFFNFIYIWNILIIIFLSIIKMKKKRYGIPIYFTSSIMVGTLINYYFYNTWDKLKKSDKILFYIQNAINSIAIIFSFLLIFRLKDKINYAYIFIVIILFIFFCYLQYKCYKNKAKYWIKFVILTSGMLFILINIFITPLVEKYIRNNANRKYPLVEKNINVYSDYFEIEDVWKIGNKIITLTKDKNQISENKIYFLSAEKSTETLAKLFKNYTIKNKIKFKNFENKDVVLYYLEKNGDN